MWCGSFQLSFGFASRVPKKPPSPKSQENHVLFPLRLATDLFEPIASLGCGQCSSPPVLQIFVVIGIEATRNMWAYRLLRLVMPNLKHASGLQDPIAVCHQMWSGTFQLCSGCVAHRMCEARPQCRLNMFRCFARGTDGPNRLHAQLARVVSLAC